jgi:hypothetical protein
MLWIYGHRDHRIVKEILVMIRPSRCSTKLAIFLRMRQQGGWMDGKKWYGTLIVVTPGTPRTFKIRFTWNAFRGLMLAILVSFLVLVSLRHTVRALVDDRDRSRLAEENLQLRVKNQNTEIAGIQLKDRVAKLEERARQIEEILEEQLLPTTPEAAAADKDK